MATVKAEGQPELKLEPPVSTPNTAQDADEFEDDTDLVIPPPGGQAWLVKLPSYVWQTWQDLYSGVSDDQPLEIGKMRVYKDAGGDPDPMKQRVQMRLHDLPQQVDLPKNYDLHITTRDYSNVVVFSEKDLPGHKSHPFGRRSHLSAPRPFGLQPKSDRYPPLKPRSYRTAIPKQTALAPMVQHIADAHPVEDESYYRHFSKTYQASLQPKKTTTFQTGIDRRIQPAALADFSAFNITSRPGAAKGKKRPAPKEKAVRISEQALLDAIYQCFRRFRYWSLKALKNELRQPEQYIKQTLDGIATLVRSGDFAMNYVLNPEYASIANIRPEDVKDETAAVKSEVESDLPSDDDMDAGDMFEDVKMEGT